MNPETSCRSEIPTLFIWRGQQEFAPPAGTPRGKWASGKPVFPLPINPKACPYCASPTDESSMYVTSSALYLNRYCQVCGFRYDWFNTDLPLDVGDRYGMRASTLHEFQINDEAVAYDELVYHLQNVYDDIYSLTPRRFEELCAAVFSNLGFTVELTKQTRDGGVDLVLLARDSERKVIVDCKRYRPDRKVDVGIVRQMLGVQLLWGEKEAALLTTSSFTTPAMDEAARAVTSGYKLDLITADEVLNALDVRHAASPSLEVVFSNRDRYST